MLQYFYGGVFLEDIYLLGKVIVAKKSKILLKYSPDEHWLDYWEPKSGNWLCENGYLYGIQPGNSGGILFSKQRFDTNVLMSFTVGAELPATRDLNAVFCAEWDNNANYLGNSYVCGLNGWYDNKSGIEKCMADGSDFLYATTSCYKYTPGTEVKMTVGAIDGHCFMIVDGVLVSEMLDPRPLKGGHLGFSAYCTKLKIKDIEIREIVWEPIRQLYTPEF